MLLGFALALLLNQPLASFGLGQGMHIAEVDQEAAVSMGIKTTAQSVLIADVSGGKDPVIIYQKNPHKVVPIASLTKLMSMMILLENGAEHPRMITMGEEDEVKDEKDAQRLSVVKGEEIAWNDMIRAALMFSANNAVKALVRASGAREDVVVQEMNQRAELWGMQSTAFTDVIGISPRNVAPASDILVLAQQAFANDHLVNAGRGVVHTFSAKSSKGTRGVTLRHTDRSRQSFINDDRAGFTVVASKTGYVKEGGYHLVSKVRKEEKEIMMILLGSATSHTRFQEAKALVWWAFEKAF